MERGRILGIDAGERRVGLALSDETRLLATPFTVLQRGAGLAGVMDEIAAVARRESVVKVVVGLPLNADGSSGRQARRATVFADVVRRATGLDVEMWDERLSTVEAHAILREQGRRTRRDTQPVDAVAAAVILQDYLDAHQPSAAPLPQVDD